MSKLKIAIAQINSKVGNLEYNFEKIKKYWAEAEAKGADLVVFPECSLTGYPLEDLARNMGFLHYASNYIDMLSRKARNSRTAIVFGAPRPEGNKVFNTLYFMQGENTKVFRKFELPNYGVFDEQRNFDRPSISNLQTLVRLKDFVLQFQICEDIWHPNVTKLGAGRDAIIVINGSPWEKEKLQVRYEIIDQRIREIGRATPVFYCNMVGGQDELVFDGASFVELAGRKIQMVPWEESLEFFTMEKDAAGTPSITSTISGEKSLENYNRSMMTTRASYEAQVLGLRDYMSKIGFKKAVIGISGGVDSALVAAIAVDALGADNVLGVRMPSRYSSQHSLDDAEELCRKLGIEMRTVPIDDAHKAFESMLPKNLSGVSGENIQARIRGNILMAISNSEGSMVLSTGNKTEVSVGYATLYGDMAGGFNPIKDAYKTEVWAECHWRNRNKPAGALGPDGVVIPEQIISKPPSAELAPGQMDTDSLPEYPVLDKILECIIEKKMDHNSAAAEADVPLAVVLGINKKLISAEYKRRQSCPGPKISSMIHGRDRRWPIANGWNQ